MIRPVSAKAGKMIRSFWEGQTRLGPPNFGF